MTGGTANAGNDTASTDGNDDTTASTNGNDDTALPEMVILVIFRDRPSRDNHESWLRR